MPDDIAVRTEQHTCQKQNEPSQSLVAWAKLLRNARKKWAVMLCSESSAIFRVTEYNAVVAAPTVKTGSEHIIHRRFSQQA